jgi:hypothetical protein
MNVRPSPATSPILRRVVLGCTRFIIWTKPLGRPFTALAFLKLRAFIREGHLFYTCWVNYSHMFGRFDKQ